MKYQTTQCIGMRLRRLSRTTDSFYRNILKEFPITENQMAILFVLDSLGKVEQGKIGQVLGLERSTVSRNMKLLEKLNLIERTIDYRPDIQLTDEGNKLVKQLIPEWEKLMDSLVDKIGKEGLSHIADLEGKLN